MLIIYTVVSTFFYFPLLGKTLLALLVFGLVKIRQRKTWSRNQQWAHTALAVSTLAVIAIQLAIAVLGTGLYDGILRIVFPLVWGVGLVHALDAFSFARKRQWKNSAGRLPLPAALVFATAIWTGLLASIHIEVPQHTVDPNGTMTIDISLGLLSPPGYIDAYLGPSKQPTRSNERIYSSSMGGYLTEAPFFMAPGTTKRLTLPANAVWCHFLDISRGPCPTGPGRYHVQATMSLTPDAFSERHYPQIVRGLGNTTSEPFSIWNEDSERHYQQTAKKVIAEALAKQWEHTIFTHNSSRRTDALVEERFERRGERYCGTWGFAPPFLGHADACIGSQGADGAEGFFRTSDVQISVFNLRFPAHLPTPREAIITAKKAVLIHARTHATDPMYFAIIDYMSEMQNSPPRLSLEAWPKDSGRYRWNVKFDLKHMVEPQIQATLLENGDVCLKRPSNSRNLPDAPCDLGTVHAAELDKN